MSAPAVLGAAGAVIALALQLLRVVRHPGHNYRAARWLLGAFVLLGSAWLLIFFLRAAYVTGMAGALISVLLGWAGGERLLPALREREAQTAAIQRRAEKAAGNLSENLVLLAATALGTASLCIEAF